MKIKENQPVIKDGNEIEFPKEVGIYPILIKNNSRNILTTFLTDNRDWVDQNLLEYGAMLFRGFEVEGSEGFNNLLPFIFEEEIEYKQRTSPRHTVVGNVYTSTDYPNNQKIHMHTESSYSALWANRICFYANVVSNIGGQTPIADVRKVMDSLDASIIKKFEEKGVMYIRNIQTGVGMTWKEIYQVESKIELEEMLDKTKVKYSWIGDDSLRISWVRPALQKHPATNETVWFNHAYFYSKHLLDDFILEVISEDDLPFLSFYGDGSEIEKDVIEAIKEAYEQNLILFKWEKNDVLLLDNMLFAHGRMPYEGERQILVAMGNPLS
ncbi:TauD/TfdA family dioxygenase [Dokdonia sp.]|uniref:TauD/TfdA family dioxygenase n=1 Tax=Dokdonia sp. TaxID=2024995 RepID=UPI003267B8A3